MKFQARARRGSSGFTVSIFSLCFFPSVVRFSLPAWVGGRGGGNKMWPGVRNEKKNHHGLPDGDVTLEQHGASKASSDAGCC